MSYEPTQEELQAAIVEHDLAGGEWSWSWELCARCWDKHPERRAWLWIPWLGGAWLRVDVRVCWGCGTIHAMRYDDQAAGIGEKR